jgi:hypothetical protein
VVVDDLVGGFGEEEVEMNVVFAGQALQHWLVYYLRYDARRTITNSFKD